MKRALWLFALVASLAAGAPPKTVAGNDPPALYDALTAGKEWLGVSRPIAADDLARRILVLDFWTYGCVRCVRATADLLAVEKELKGAISVVAVHSPKFPAEKDRESLRAALQRLALAGAVLDDADGAVAAAFGVTGWPTLALVGPNGEVLKTVTGEANAGMFVDAIRAVAAKLGKRQKGLPVIAESLSARGGVLRFPGKLLFVPDHEGQPTLFVSDTGHDRIVAVGTSGSEAGTVRFAVGGARGYADGGFAEARFASPQGLAYDDGALYVADSGNHAVRRIDFRKKTVATVAGTGGPGALRIAKNAPATRTPLDTPWDLAFFPSRDRLVVAMAGGHQLWSLDVPARTISVLAGSGVEGLHDGEYPLNALAEPLGAAAAGSRLYFVDSQTSALRVLENGAVTTLAGLGLAEFGRQNGARAEARLQHPGGVYAEAGRVLVADTFNHSVRRFDPKTKTLATVAGDGSRGQSDGPLAAARFDEPGGLAKGAGEVFYVADTNNHAVRVLDLGAGTVRTLTVTEGNAPAARHLARSLPNTKPLDVAEVRAGAEIPVKLALGKEWKINETAPTWLAVFRTDAKGERLIKEYARDELRKGEVRLPKLEPGKYRMQGLLYYCRAGAVGACLLRGYDRKLEARGESGAGEIAIALGD